jgi:hypothetical protein
MSKKKSNEREREAQADELLLRALRQLADEALEDEIPERLLRPLREARGGGGKPESTDRPQDAPRDTPERRRRGAGSA